MRHKIQLRVHTDAITLSITSMEAVQQRMAEVVAGSGSSYQQPPDPQLLNEIFQGGKAPDGLDGFYGGAWLGSTLGPALQNITTAVTSLYMPWRGKRFFAGENRGENVLIPKAKPLIRALWPTYSALNIDGMGLSGFRFKTYVAPSHYDDGLTVLSIDYDIGENPRFVIRRVLDELIQIGDDLYLGRMLIKVDRRWRLIGFFALGG